MKTFWECWENVRHFVAKATSCWLYQTCRHCCKNCVLYNKHYCCNGDISRNLDVQWARLAQSVEQWTFICPLPTERYPRVVGSSPTLGTDFFHWKTCHLLSLWELPTLLMCHLKAIGDYSTLLGEVKVSCWSVIQPTANPLILIFSFWFSCFNCNNASEMFQQSWKNLETLMLQ